MSGSSQRFELDQFLLSGYIRENAAACAIIPTEIIQMCFSFYHIKCEILQFSVTHKSKRGIMLDLNNTRATLSDVPPYQWILCDIEPVTDGIHCFRFQIHNPSKKRMSFGMGMLRMYEDAPLSQQGKDVYAIGYQMYYPIHEILYSKETYPYPKMRKIVDFHLDMLFDADKGEIRYAMLENIDGAEQKTRIWGIPMNKIKGLVPHITFDRRIQNTSLRVAKIPVDWFHKTIDNMFD
eukprot:438818_1